jgi:hypothetical protein
LRPELRRVREICGRLPGVEERLSHGTPAFFAAGRQFLHFWDDHHGDGRLALWCAAPLGAQEALTQAAPERFFVPPYVGRRGWIGLRLDGAPDWAEVEQVIGRAHRAVQAPAPSGRR